MYVVDGSGSTRTLDTLEEGMAIEARERRTYEAGSGFTEGYDPAAPELITRELVFVRWLGDTEYLADPAAAATALRDVERAATESDALVLVAEYALSGQTTDYNPRRSWKDSVAVLDRATGRYECYCDSNGYDHSIGDHVPLGETQTVREICENVIGDPDPADVEFSKAKGVYREYNDIQCGNGPANDAGDEDFDNCPGRVNSGSAGCFDVGPHWPERTASSVAAAYSVTAGRSVPGGGHAGIREESPAQNAIDGDPRTRWVTGAGQVPGRMLEIALHGERRVARIGMASGGRPGVAGEHPRLFRVHARHPQGGWVPVHVGIGDPGGRTVVELADPVVTDRLRIELLAASPYPWSIRELEVSASLP